MWDTLTDKDKQVVEEIYKYFTGEFTEINPKTLKDRIYSGYCWGEGGSRILTIEDWKTVFYGSGLQKILLTSFDDWDDYSYYNGDFHKKTGRDIKKQD